jgi:hypothetical protein
MIVDCSSTTGSSVLEKKNKVDLGFTNQIEKQGLSQVMFHDF